MPRGVGARADSISLDELKEFVGTAERLLSKKGVDEGGLSKALGYRTTTHFHRIMNLEGSANRKKLERLRALVEADRAGEFNEVFSAMKRRKTNDRKPPSQPAIGGASGKMELGSHIVVKDGQVSLEECGRLNTRRTTNEQAEIVRSLASLFEEQLVGDGKPFSSRTEIWRAAGYLGSGGFEVMRNRSRPTAWKLVRLLAMKNAIEEHGDNAAVWFLPGGPHGPEEPIPFEYLHQGEAGLEYAVMKESGAVKPAPEPEPEPEPEVEEAETPEEKSSNGRPSWMETVAEVEQHVDRLTMMGERLANMAGRVEELTRPDSGLPALIRKSLAPVAMKITQMNEDFNDQLGELHDYLEGE